MESKAGFRFPGYLLPFLKVLFQNNLSITLLCGNMCVCVCKIRYFSGQTAASICREQHAGTYLPKYTALHPGRQLSSYSPLREPPNSHVYKQFYFRPLYISFATNELRSWWGSFLPDKNSAFRTAYLISIKLRVRVHKSGLK